MSQHGSRRVQARGFRRFWWGESVSGFGSAVTTLSLQTLVVVTLGGSAADVGWLNSARWLPYLALGLVVGALVARVRRRPVMIASDLIRAALLAAIPLAWLAGVLTLPLLLVVVVCFGIVSLLNDAASMSFLTRLVPAAQLQRAHARLDGADAVAQTGGPAVAGVLIKLVGAPVAVLVDALSYLFSAAVVLSLRSVAEPAGPPGPGTPAAAGGRGRRLRAEIREGVVWVYGRSGLRRLAVATHVWFAAQAVLGVVVTPYALRQLGLSPFQLGLVLGVGGVGALVGATVSTAVGVRLGTGGAIICSHLVSLVGALVMLAAGLGPAGSGSTGSGTAGSGTPGSETAVWVAAAVLAVGQLLHGWAMGLSNSHEMSYRQVLTPDALQARTNTTMRSLNRAVLVVVSPLAGLLADRLGFGPALGVSATVFAVSAALLLVSPFRRVRLTPPD